MVLGAGCLSTALAAQPTKLTLPLPLVGTDFFPRNIGYASDGAQLCLAGTNSDEDGRATAQLLLIERTGNTVSWQKKLPPPDGYSDIYPVQCVKDATAVYLLANVDTQSVKTLRQTRAYVYRFDLQGKQTGYTVLSLPGRDHFAYSMIAAAGGVKVAGYIKDEDADFEYYSMFALSLDGALRAGQPSIKNTGAFAPFPARRIIGEHLFIAGNFYPHKVSKSEGAGDFAASRLRLNGAYLWSVHPQTDNPRSVFTAIAGDGGVFRVAYQGQTSSLLLVTPEGKAGAEITYASKYCDTKGLAEYGGDYLAIRTPCDGQGERPALLRISPASKKERTVAWFADKPLYIATDAATWTAVAKDGAGKIVLYSGQVGRD